MESRRERFEASGQVQGVGFRPYVYRLARSLGLTGTVINDSSGAAVEVQGAADVVETFARRLVSELPPLAEIHACRRIPLPPVEGETEFRIEKSRGGEITDAQVTVDTATCADCLNEMLDQADPRYHYPFINCTNCGPRYTIIKKIPYDRPNTTMAEFALCPMCGGQYADPMDRRFHAQPIACPKCGPHVWLTDGRGKTIECDDAIAAAADLLRRGRIVAIKGLGGFHLACRADDDHAVRRLRLRKRRDAKPFALMVADVAAARLLCEFDADAEKLLSGSQRPILLMRRRRDAGAGAVAASVAPGLDTLGVMLPYTPLHHLLFAHGLGPLVMTSGNVSDEPLTRENEDAIAHLGHMADALLLHNRRIQRSLDDSVVQLGPDGRAALIRRARGYAPQPVVMGTGKSPAILAVGGELKSTVCLYKDGRAVMSEHVGDLKDGRVYRHFMQVINDLENLFEIEPELIVADLHPAYLSGQYAVARSTGRLAGKPAIPLIRVQHHHAHVAACLAEHGRSDAVIGLCCDGTGYGDDGAIWGCEIMRADLAGYQRLGHLRYVPLPGGDAAAEHTWRPALSALIDAFGDAWTELPVRTILAEVAGDEQALDLAAEAIRAQVNCPRSSSLGRWFDAVAGLVGLAQENRYEGQAPIRLEASIEPGVRDAYAFEIIDAGPSFHIDLRPMTRQLVRDVAAAAPAGVVAARFHNTVAAFLLAAAQRGRELTGLKTVALTGGCFANRYLLGLLREQLREAGFEVLTHQRIPSNDGGVALGQAIVAAAQWQRQARASGPSLLKT